MENAETDYFTCAILCQTAANLKNGMLTTPIFTEQEIFYLPCGVLLTTAKSKMLCTQNPIFLYERSWRAAITFLCAPKYFFFLTRQRFTRIGLPSRSFLAQLTCFAFINLSIIFKFWIIHYIFCKTFSLQVSVLLLALSPGNQARNLSIILL